MDLPLNIISQRVALWGTSRFTRPFLQKRGKLNSMFDWIFAFIHLLALLGALGYAFYFLFQGNISNFIIGIGLITAYYLIVLRKAVKKEIEKKKSKTKELK